MTKKNRRMLRRTIGVVSAALFLAACNVDPETTETFDDEEAVEMAAASLSPSSGGQTSTLDDPAGSPPATGSFTATVTRDFANLDSTRDYSLSISNPNDATYEIDGSISGSADRPRIDSTYESTIDLTVEGWDNSGLIIVNGTSSRQEQIDYDGIARSATRNTDANQSFVWNNVEFDENDVDGNVSTEAVPVGGTIVVEADYRSERANGVRSSTVEWSGTITFAFFADGTATASVNGESYSINLAAVNDADLVE